MRQITDQMMSGQNQEQNEKITISHEEKVLSDFKNYFTKQLEQGIIIRENEIPAKEKIISWYHSVKTLSVLTTHLTNSNVREIIIHTPPFIHLDINGNLFPIALNNFDHETFKISLKWLTVSLGIQWNLTSPFASFTTVINYQSLRITLLHPSITPQNHFPKAFIRKLSQVPLTFNDFQITDSYKELFSHLISKKKNMLIAGATNSGKTTFVQMLLSLIPKEEHVVVLEDTHELKVPSPYFTHLISSSEVERNQNKSLKEYMAMSLRLRPDRIILGEIRSCEVVPFLLALNTGHQGLLSTLHANSAEDALDRLCLLFTLYHQGTEWDIPSLKKLITKNLDYIIFMEGKKVSKIIHLKD